MSQRKKVVVEDASTTTFQDRIKTAVADYANLQATVERIETLIREQTKLLATTKSNLELAKEAMFKAVWGENLQDGTKFISVNETVFILTYEMSDNTNWDRKFDIQTHTGKVISL